MKRIWDSLKPLVCEGPSSRLSAGRIGFWIIFAVCLHFWMLCRTDIPPHLFATLGAFLAYNFGKKTRLNTSRGDT